MAIFWALAGVIAAIYCLARGVFDFREKRYVWAAVGIASGIAILFIPMPQQTHAIEVVLPAN